MKPIEFTMMIKKLSLCYGKDFDEDQIKIWYEYFKDIKKEVLNSSLDKIIKNNKYMPSISEILEECKTHQKHNRYNIIEVMKRNGYFKISTEYDKANKWIEEENIPKWFLEDMKKYYNNYLENKEQKLIGGR